MADVEERLARVEAALAEHLENTENDPYRLATVELAVKEHLEALLGLVAALIAMAQGRRL